MPTLLNTEDMPAGLLDRLRESAAANNRPLGAEVVRLLDRALGGPPLPPTNGIPAGRGAPPADPSDETAAGAPSEADNVVYDFPRPLTGVPIRVVVGGERLPALPVILDETPE